MHCSDRSEAERPSQYLTTGESVLAWSIQRPTWDSAGHWRTKRFFLALFASTIFSVSDAALRRRSSFTVSTPAASSRSLYWVDTPFTRMRSARLTHSSTSLSLMPHLSAIALRPFRVAPASSNFSQGLMPSPTRFFAYRAPMAIRLTDPRLHRPDERFSRLRGSHRCMVDPHRPGVATTCAGGLPAKGASS